MSTCRICKSTNPHTEYEPRELMFGTREVFKYFQCSDCECLQITDIPSDMSSHYPDNYYSYSESGSQSGWEQFKKRMSVRYAAFGGSALGRYFNKRDRYYDVESLRPLNLKADARILDVGCGSGYFLDALADAGFESLMGIDPYLSDELSSNPRLHQLDIFQVDGEFDVVTFHHSLEHLEDPIAVLEKAKQLLAPGGHCVIRVPTVSSEAWERYGIDWVQLDAPRHFYLFSLKSMEKLATAAGLKLDNILFDSDAFQFWGSEQYLADIALNDDRSYATNPDKSMFSPEDIGQFQAQSIKLNENRRGDSIAAYLSV